MFKVKALREFTYGSFDKIKNLERHNKEKKKEGTLYAGDIFECTEKMAQYLTGECGYVLVRVIEVIPEEVKKNELGNPVDTREIEEKPKKTTKKKK